MLLITVDGPDARQVEREYEAIGELCLDARRHRGLRGRQPHHQRADLEGPAQHRRGVQGLSPHQSLEDIVVPIAGIPELVPAWASSPKRTTCRFPATATPATATCTPRP